MGLLGLLSWGSHWILPRLIDLEAIEDTIEETVQESTGIQLSIEHLSIRLTLTRGIEVTFQGNVLRDPEGARLVDVQRIVANIRYWPLITEKRKEISQLSFEDTTLFIDERSFLFRIQPAPTAEEGEVQLVDTRLIFTHYTVIANRSLDPLNSYRLQGRRLMADHVASDRPLELQGDGALSLIHDPIPMPLGEIQLQLQVDKKMLEGALGEGPTGEERGLRPEYLQKLDIHLQNVQLATITEALYPHGIILQAQGDVPTLRLSYRQRLQQPNRITLQAHTRTPITLDIDDYHLALQPGRVRLQSDLIQGTQLQNLHMALRSQRFDADIRGDLALQREILESIANLSIQTSRFSLSSLGFLPGDTPLGRLARQATGTLQLQGHMAGRLGSPALTGNLQVWNGQWSPAPDLQLAQVEARISLMDDGIQLAPLRGQLNGQPFSISLTHRPEDAWSQGQITITRLDLHAAEALYRTLVTEWGVPPAPPINTAMQQLDLWGAVSLQGSWAGPTRSPQVRGQADLHQIRIAARYGPGVPLVQQLDGRLYMEGDTVAFPAISFHINGTQQRDTPLQARGTYHIPTTRLVTTLQGSQIESAGLAQAIRRISAAFNHPIEALERLAFTGPGDLNLTLSMQVREPETFRLFGRAVLNGVTLSAVPNGQVPILQNTQGLLTFQNSVLQASPLRFVFGETPLLLQGQYDLAAQTMALQLTGNQVQLSPLDQHLRQVANQLAIPLPWDEGEALAGEADFRLMAQGSLPQPQITGQVTLRQGEIDLPLPPQGERIPLRNIAGRILLLPNIIALENLQGQVNGNRLRVDGTLDPALQTYNLTLLGQNLNLAQLRREVLDRIPAVRQQLAPLHTLAGRGNLALQIASRNGTPHINGQLFLSQLTLQTNDLPEPLRLQQVQVLIAGNNVQIPQTQASLGGLPFRLQASIVAGRYDAALQTDPIPVALVRDDTVIRRFLEEHAPFPLPELYNTAGTFSLEVRLTPGQLLGRVRLDQAGASWQGALFPLYDITGDIAFTQDGLSFPSPVSFRYANTPVRAEFLALAPPEHHMIVSGEIAPLLANYGLRHLIDPREPQAQQLLVHASLPFRMESLGRFPHSLPSLEGGDLQLVLDVDLGELLHTQPLQIVAQTPSPPYATGLSMALHLQEDKLSIDDTVLSLEGDPVARLTGSIRHLETPENLTYKLHARTEPALSLERVDSLLADPLFEGAQGLLQADVYLSQKRGEEGESSGTITLEEVSIPYLEVEEITGFVGFNGPQARIQFPTVRLPGIDLGLDTYIPNIFSLPLRLDNLIVQGSYLNIQQFLQTLQEQMATDWQDSLLQPLAALGESGPRQPVTIPVLIQNGILNIDDVVYENLIMENLNALLSIDQWGQISLEDAHFRTADGDVRGRLWIHPLDNNAMGLDLRLIDVQANALMTALLNQPNVIFGDLSGTVAITTEGSSKAEMIESVNGEASLYVTNGRLPAIARVETLLTAAGLIRGGLLGLNLNQLFRALAPLDTNYFAELTGDFTLQDGLLSTDNLLSEGENLDLFVSGSIRLADSFADLLVYGEMSQAVTGALGPLGQISLGAVTAMLPGLGFLPEGAPGLLNYVPGLGFIPFPGLGGPARGVSRFRVRIVGPLENPDSIQALEWL
jgi:hypothetical protein